jgi:hypothetical protein
MPRRPWYQFTVRSLLLLTGLTGLALLWARFFRFDPQSALLILVLLLVMVIVGAEYFMGVGLIVKSFTPRPRIGLPLLCGLTLLAALTALIVTYTFVIVFPASRPAHTRHAN